MAESTNLNIPISQDPELLQDFLVESRGHLTNIEQQVLVLESDPAHRDAMNSLFRSFHTIKGLAGFLEMPVIEEVAHEAETLLDGARNGQRAIDEPLIDRMLAARDYLNRWLQFLDPANEGKVVEPESAADLLALLHGLVMQEAAEAPDAEEPALTVPPQPSGCETAVAPPDSVAAKAESAASPDSSLVKINTAKLEYLVDMVGELVIAQSMLRHDPEMEALHAPRLQRKLAQLARVTGEVQKTAMAMRMVKIGGLFQRMRRLVRDLSRKSGKRADLELIGEDVELDRSLVEELADPLVHMLRNAMDHGLETPQERQAAGKSETGHIQLRACHQGGQIVIEVADDGRGLNRDRILEKAIARGLLQPGAKPADAAVFALIFEPGFSTAEKVTEVSGRGVGMDVVRKQLEKLRGRIDIESEPGKGSKFFLTLPLTLAIIDGLVVTVAGERFIVPVSAVRELFRPAPDTVFTVQQRQEMVLVRGHLLPVVRLSERLGITQNNQPPAQAGSPPSEISDSHSAGRPGALCGRVSQRTGLLIVGEAEGGQFCLHVEDLLGKQEVVIKSLGPMFAQASGLAGCAILGDGRVGLILEMNALWKGGSHGAGLG